MNAWAASAWDVAVVVERKLKERCNSARRWDSVTRQSRAHEGPIILAACPYQKSRPGWRRWSDGLPSAGMLDLLKLVGGFAVGLFRLPAAREAELAFLRQQLLVLRRPAPARLRLRMQIG